MGPQIEKKTGALKYDPLSRSSAARCLWQPKGATGKRKRSVSFIKKRFPSVPVGKKEAELHNQNPVEGRNCVCVSHGNGGRAESDGTSTPYRGHVFQPSEQTTTLLSVRLDVYELGSTKDYHRHMFRVNAFYINRVFWKRRKHFEQDNQQTVWIVVR